MNFKHFEFNIKDGTKSIPATCDIYTNEESDNIMPYKFPIYRVALNLANKKRVFLFYEINEPDQRFYFYAIEGIDKRQLALAIIDELEKIS